MPLTKGTHQLVCGHHGACISQVLDTQEHSIHNLQHTLCISSHNIVPCNTSLLVVRPTSKSKQVVNILWPGRLELLTTFLITAIILYLILQYNTVNFHIH